VQNNKFILSNLLCFSGEAQAATLLGEAISKNPGYLKLRKLRASGTIAKTISSAQNRVYLNAGTLMLNINDEDYEAGLKNISKGGK